MSKLYTCTKCKKKKQYNEFVKRKRNKLGIEKTCKLCASLVKKDYYIRNKDKVKKKVSECKALNKDMIEEKAKISYYKNIEKNKEKRKRYYANNRVKSKQKSLEYYYNNRERVLETVKRYAEKNKDIIKIKAQEYNKNNPEIGRANSALRRARKKNASPKWLTATHLATIKSIYKAANNLSKKTGVAHHVDHIVPLSGKLVCGLHVPWNLQVLTQYNNLSKHNKFDEDMI